MMKAAKGKKIAVFLDYDGTLSPIVDDPDRAFMSDEVIKLCSRLYDSIILTLTQAYIYIRLNMDPQINSHTLCY